MILDCSICGKKFNFKYGKSVYEKRKAGLNMFYCSKECRNNKKATKIRYEHQKNIMLKKYGVSNNFQRKEIVEKIQNKRDINKWRNSNEQTLLKKYGVKNNQQFKEFKNKSMETCEKKYGNSVYCNTKEYNKVRIENNLKKYGVKYFFQSDDFRKIIEEKYDGLKEYKFGSENFKKSMVNIYGVENCMHIPEIAERVLSKSRSYKYTNKFYTMPSGKKIRIQGYENKTLDKLLDIFDESLIFYKKQDIPEFWYIFEGRNRRYYPDFFIPSKNIIIETKSKYTLEIEKEKNDKKFQSVKDNGYKLILDLY